MIRQKNQLPSLAKVAYALIILGVALAFLYLARPVLLPLAFSAFVALLVFPLCRFLEDNGFSRIFAIILTFIIIALSLSGLVFLLSQEVISFVNSLPDLEDQVNNMLDELEYELFKNFNIIVDLHDSLLNRSTSDFFNSGVFLLQGTISTFVDIFTFVGLIPVYVFLLLLYRSSFKAFLLFIMPIERHRAVRKIIFQVQKVVQNYIVGLLMVMGIVGILNSAALYFIGVDYPLFFGFLAAFLMIIPYIGVFIGSLLPALYALVSMGTLVHPLAVILSFGFIQFLEGNFITPRITGSKVKLNPLASIIALVVGGYMWGVGGLILALPLVAILKVILDNINAVKHYGFLLGSEIYEGNVLNMGSYIKSKQFRIAGWNKKGSNVKRSEKKDKEDL